MKDFVFAWICLDDLCVKDVSIGVYKEEKNIKRDIFLDIAIFRDIKKTKDEDLLEHTIDYSEIADHICKISRERHYNLLESLALTLVDSIIETFKVKHVKINVRKKNVCQNSTATIKLERKV